VLVVHGLEGMDEASLGGATLVGELVNGEVREYEIHPEDYGLPMASNRSLCVSNREESCEMVLRALSNEAGPARDIVVFNAGLAMYAGNVADSIEDGIKKAFELVASGAARAKVDEFVNFTRQAAGKA